MKVYEICLFLTRHLYQRGQKEGYARLVDALAAACLITWVASITDHANIHLTSEKCALFIGGFVLISIAAYFRKERP